MSFLRRGLQNVCAEPVSIVLYDPRDGLPISPFGNANPPVSPAPAPEMHLTTDSDARKEIPLATGVLDYFPDALADVARLSKIGNDKHNPGEPLHWARGKSMDQADCILRHMIDRGKIDTDGVLHDTKVAWRALAQLQLTIERLRAAGVNY
jgi:hypothetical protein